MTVEKDSIEIKIDGETLKFKLSASQKAQLKRATKKVVEDAPLPTYAALTFACKKAKGSFPLVIMSNNLVNSATYDIKSADTMNLSDCRGRDFSLGELKTFIRELKGYASKIWATAEKELKNV